MQDNRLTDIANTLDQMINLDITARGCIGILHKAAREKAGQPLTLQAVYALQNAVMPGDQVLIATGWEDQPLAAPGCGESDGPAGAVALARALRLTLQAAPIIVTDACLVEGVKEIARAAGFQCVEPEDLHHSIQLGKLITLSVVSFPSSHEGAREAAVAMLDRFKPAACIAIERGGMNSAGKIHNMAGRETGEHQAKIDYIFQMAAKRDICTVGIGDGGNEIGMGNIADAVRKEIPFGICCQCDCGEGIAPETQVDVLVTATVSNWGGYALAALLALATDEWNGIHEPERETRLLEATAAAGFHDPILGWVAPSADGCQLPVHVSMVTLIREAVLQYRKRCWQAG